MFGIEIIPNTHPMFVHFTVALLSLSVVFHLLDFLTKGAKPEWRTLAQWNLWLGAGFAIVTVLAGIYAYNTVAHDGPSHAAMTLHRNWALPTLLVFLLLAGWSFMNTRMGKAATVPFLVVLVIGGGLLLSTAWHGAELVYRHGLGVISLPVVSNKGHDDGHGHTHGSAQGSESSHHDGMSMDDVQGSASVAGGDVHGSTNAASAGSAGAARKQGATDMSMKGMDMKGMDMKGMDMEGMDMEGMDMEGMDMEEAHDSAQGHDHEH